MTRRRLSTAIMLTLSLSLTACSAKPSADTTETSTEVVTKEETISSSSNDPSDNDVSANNAKTVYESEAETESEPSSEEGSVSEDETEDETEDVSTASETESSSAKKTTAAAETTAQTKTATVPETTTEAVTVQSVSASVSGTHYIGETLSGADFTVTVTMSDGSALTNPEGWGAQPLTLSDTSNLITVSYQGASVTITVSAENVPETTKAQIVAETTTQATAAATTAATTTAAETTTTSGVEWVEWADGDWNYALARALFIAQNEMRAEAGVDPLIWDDQMYEAAKQCAKVCGDNGVIDHDLTSQYNDRVNRVAYTGETINVSYGENLHLAGSASNTKRDDVSSYSSYASGLLVAIKISSPHYKGAISNVFQYGAIAVYKMDGTMYISYLFYEGDDIFLTN